MILVKSEKHLLYTLCAIPRHFAARKRVFFSLRFKFFEISLAAAVAVVIAASTK